MENDSNQILRCLGSTLIGMICVFVSLVLPTLIFSQIINVGLFGSVIACIIVTGDLFTIIYCLFSVYFQETPEHKQREYIV
jgi:hypothetical protein